MTTEPRNIRELLYPTEWAFRFFIAGFLVWIAGNIMPQPDPLFAIGFYVLAVGACVAVVWQVIVFIRFQREA